jgi:hypothetical protein
MMEDDSGRVPAEPGSREPNPSVSAASGFDPSRVRGWLVSMTKQGEDYIWRPAEKALACFDSMADEIERLKQPRFHEPGYQAPPPVLHPYKPNRQYPWFCEACGYPEHERLKHPSKQEQ